MLERACWPTQRSASGQHKASFKMVACKVATRGWLQLLGEERHHQVQQVAFLTRSRQIVLNSKSRALLRMAGHLQGAVVCMPAYA